MRFRVFSLLLATTLLQARESFHYTVEWRMIDAGIVDFALDHNSAQLKVLSTGLVSRLFKVNDIYESHFNDQLCAQETRLQAEEGSRRRDTRVKWSGLKSHYLERDLVKNEVVLERQLDVPACVHDILGGMVKLRSLNLQPGQNTTIPLSDGKKFVNARIEAREKEQITTELGKFNAIKLEAFLFNDVLFKRNARLFIWITDDARRLPIQVQVRMRIHIGTVTFQLDKVEQ